jgi:hypothetical protein
MFELKGRTWVGREANNLGASKAVTIVALWTNKEGRCIGGRVPPTLETCEVYILQHRKAFRERCDDNSVSAIVHEGRGRFAVR